MPERDGVEAWNHNIHHFPVVLDAVRPGYERALDVGCGAGDLVRALSRAGLRVTGIDADPPTLARARDAVPSTVELVEGDVLTFPFAPATFDLVASIAVLHHMDTHAGLARMSELVAPGGTMVVVGLARTRAPFDGAYDTAGLFATRYQHRRHRGAIADVAAPMVWPPPDTFGAVRAVAEEVLPGVRYRRHVLFRYSLTWVKPAG